MRVPDAARDLRGVLERLDAIVADAASSGDRVGYFAALYRRVTRAVADKIARGEFDDGARMDRLDTEFANRYFAALARHLAGSEVPRAWRVALGTTSGGSATVLQHLMLGVNAHINVDLGAATATVCRGLPLEPVRHDFDRINGLLARLTDDVQQRLGAVSPLMHRLDELGGAGDERFATFSMNAARSDAWRLATALHEAPEFLRPTIEWISDERAAALGHVMAHPPEPIRSVLLRIREAEVADVRSVIGVLAAA